MTGDCGKGTVHNYIFVKFSSQSFAVEEFWKSRQKNNGEVCEAVFVFGKRNYTSVNRRTREGSEDSQYCSLR